MLFLHLLKDRDDLLKGWPLARVLVHADPDELGHVWAHAGADVQPQPLNEAWRNFKNMGASPSTHRRRRVP